MAESGLHGGGVVTRTEEESPQGGPISPILANIYLHYVLDLWFEKKATGMSKGEASPADERKAIQQVFVWWDHRVAQEIGTNKRIANADVRAFDADHNFDCWDTTRNASSLLLVLQEWGLLRYHRVTDPRYRGNLFVGQLPHNTAVLQETAAAGTKWVVDQWPTAFGQVPDVMTLDKWLKEL